MVAWQGLLPVHGGSAKAPVHGGLAEAAVHDSIAQEPSSLCFGT